tara:strand:+ start:2145 stop:3089 length:945 start_codon:yes stop_codon:yes gene_type:complete
MTKKIFLAGHKGMVGNAILNELNKTEDSSVITAEKRSLDLRNQSEVINFFGNNEFDEVYLSAARVGGILANNTFPAEFIYDNLMIQTNIIQACYENKISKLLFLGSSCIYPRDCNQPMKEEYLLDGHLEKTNEPYAIAKIAGIKTCEAYNKQYGTNFFSIMPTNLYGPGDNFNLKDSHVVPGLIKKLHLAKVDKLDEVVVWGTGNPKRELMHVEDLAKACIFLMNHPTQPNLSTLINVGSGIETTIYDLAYLIKEIIKYDGELKFDVSMPDGTPRKLLDSSKILSLGWKARITLKDGIESTYNWFLNNQDFLRN